MGAGKKKKRGTLLHLIVFGRRRHSYIAMYRLLMEQTGGAVVVFLEIVRAPTFIPVLHLVLGHRVLMSKKHAGASYTVV